MATDLFTLRSYWNAVEAHIARNQLEAEGIRAFVSDEGTGGLFGNQLGEAKLIVESKDAIRAAEILGLIDDEEDGEEAPADYWKAGAEDLDTEDDGRDDEDEERDSDEARPAGDLPRQQAVAAVEEPEEEKGDDGPMPMDSIRKAKAAVWVMLFWTLLPFGLLVLGVVFWLLGLIHPNLPWAILKALSVFFAGVVLWFLVRWFSR